MAPPCAIALCKAPEARSSSINALTAASAAGRSFGTTIFCGTLNRSSGNSRVPGVAAASVVRRWRDRLDRRAVEHEKALPHQHVGLRELHRPEPRRLIGDKADVGRSALDRLDDGRRAGDRLELERHIVAPGQFAGEIIGYSAHFAGRRIAHRLRRVGAEIGRAQRAARRNVAGHRGGTARKSGGNHHQAERSHRLAPSMTALALARVATTHRKRRPMGTPCQFSTRVKWSQRERQTRCAPSPACGGGVGRGSLVRILMHAPSLSLQPKSDVSDFGQSIKWPDSGKPEFGCKRGRGRCGADLSVARRAQ